MCVKMVKIPTKQSFFKNSLIVLHIFFAIIGFSIFLFNYNLSEKLLMQRTLSKQLILAKSGSSSVENLLKNTQNQLSSFVFSFAKVNESAQIDIDVTRTEFIAYMKRSQLPINGIALYDENGILSIIENKQDIRVGENQDFSRAEFIKWSKNPLNKTKVFVSTPYIGTAGASVGKIILVVAKPVYFGNKYKGTLAIRILIDDLRREFITPLTNDPDEDSFIVNSNGIFIAGLPSLINKDLYVYAKEQKWNQSQDFSQKLRAALRNNMTQTTWVFLNPKEKPKESLVGISKIDLPDTDNDLFMIITTPKDGIISALYPIRIYAFTWLGFGILTTIIGGIIVMLL